MLIGIDASRSTTAQRTGTETYSLHLIRALLDQETEHRFRLYFNQAPAPGLFPKSVETRVMPFPRLWTHVRLSREMQAAPPDVLFVPSHVLPLIDPPRSVVTVHDLGFLHYPQAHTLFQNLYLRWSTRHNARAATRIVADSEATRRALLRAYAVPADRIVVVYPGRDESLAPVTDPQILDAVRARYRLSTRYILYVGTLHPRKNLVRLVKAFAALLGSLNSTPEHRAGGTLDGDGELQLVFAGQKGWLYEEIFGEVRKLGLEDRVVFTGYMPEADLPSVLSGALAFVFPSLYEGFGLPVLEAMACGTPVVCSNVSSLPEVGGDAALLIDPLDVEALAGAMYQVISDGVLRDKLVERGMEQMRQFSWRQCASQVLEILEDTGRELG
ncbi:MAG: glycosyltransferase family 1 protein [Anaerolineae bacterium]|jgi:glycosyltransferase involved in cell wall biosynthesis